MLRKDLTMNDLIKKTPNMITPQLFKNASISMSLTGWPCAVAIISVCAACVLICKINAESKTLQPAPAIVE